MTWALLLVLACGGPDDTEAAAATPAGGQPLSESGEAPPPPPAPEEELPDEGDERVPSDLSGIDADAAEDPAARSVALALIGALDAEDAQGVVAQLSTAQKTAEGPGMFESFVEQGTTIEADEPRYLGQRLGLYHYLSDIRVTEADATDSSQPLLLHVQVGHADGEDWKVVGINAWPPEAAAPAAGSEPAAADSEPAAGD